MVSSRWTVEINVRDSIYGGGGVLRESIQKHSLEESMWTMCWRNSLARWKRLRMTYSPFHDPLIVYHLLHRGFRGFSGVARIWELDVSHRKCMLSSAHQLSQWLSLRSTPALPIFNQAARRSDVMICLSLHCSCPGWDNCKAGKFA